MEDENDLREILAKGGMRAVVTLIDASRQVQESQGEEGLRQWIDAAIEVMPKETTAQLVTFIIAKILNAYDVDVDMEGGEADGAAEAGNGTPPPAAS